MSQEVKFKQIRSDIRRGRRARIWLLIKIGFLFSLIAAVLGVYFYFNYWHYDFDDKLVDQFLNFKPPLTTEILDRNGKVLIELEGVGDWSKPPVERTPEYRHFVKYEEIPEVMRQALLAAEDQFYFNHNGLDFWGIVRAAGENVIESAKETRRKGKLTIVFAQGASTISQQAIVLSHLADDDDKSHKLMAKIRKMRMAIWLEKKLSERLGRDKAKKINFEVFANTGYCSEGRYGIFDGMKTFFGKDLKSLTKDDAPYAATVAGIFRSPRKYSPYVNPREALNRRNGILKIMAKHGFITEENFLKFKEYPLGVIPIPESKKTEAPAAVSHILKSLSPEKSLIWGNGQIIKSSIDLDAQRIANDAVRTVLEQYKARQTSHAEEATNEEDKNFFLSRVEGVEGAMVVIDNKTGLILAMVGGYNSEYQDFNRASMMMRQPGSAFKAILYGAALAQGTNVWKVDCLKEGTGECRVYDGPGMTVSMGHHKRHHIGNYTGEFYGSIPIWYAVAKSQNSAAMWLAKKLGPKAIVEFAHHLGLNKNIEEYPTTSLGAEEVTVKELATAYEIYINGGVYKEPGIVLEVTDSDGNSTRPTYENEQVLPKFIADEMVELLRHTVLYRSGTGRQLNEPGYPVQVAGKTGTTNDYRDAWFCGFNEELTVCNWVGRDDNTPLGTDSQMGIVKNKDQWCSPLHPKKKEYCEAGAKTALPAVKKFFADYYKDRIPPKFPEEMDNWIKYVHEHDKHPKR